MTDTPVTPAPWTAWRKFTQARIALGRAGHALPTTEVLRFDLAHAAARDAILQPLDPVKLAEDLGTNGTVCIVADSSAKDRAAFLRRPDLGRQLAPESERFLRMNPTRCDVALVVADGLSAPAVHAHAPAVVAGIRDRLQDLHFAPVTVIARQARVALGDRIGEILRSRLVIVLIGERPGLTSPDSLGIYITFSPRPGRSDADRNCISNIHAHGLSHDAAASRAAWLIREALRRSITGVALKDDSDSLLVTPPRP